MCCCFALNAFASVEVMLLTAEACLAPSQLEYSDASACWLAASYASYACFALSSAVAAIFLLVNAFNHTWPAPIAAPVAAPTVAPIGPPAMPTPAPIAAVLPIVPKLLRMSAVLVLP